MQNVKIHTQPRDRPIGPGMAPVQAPNFIDVVQFRFDIINLIRENSGWGHLTGSEVV